MEKNVSKVINFILNILKKILLFIIFCLVKVFFFVIDVFYNIIQLVRKRDKNKIAFLSRQLDEESINFKLLINEIKKQNENVHIYTSCMRTQYSFKYAFNILKDLWNLSNSSIAVIDGYSIPICNFTNKKLTVFQIWHSFGSMKSFGKNILDKKNGRSTFSEKTFNMHKNYDYIFASSNAYSKNLASGFGYDESKCIISPLPIVDILSSQKNMYDYKEKSDEFKAVEEKLDKSKETIVYAPTTRANTEDLRNIVFELLDIIDFNRYNLVIKTHKNDKLILTQEEIDKYLKEKYNDLKNINAYVDNKSLTAEYILISDILITDYSCAVYEAMVSGLKVFLFIPDYDKYIIDRGLEIDIKEEFKNVYAKDKNKLKNILEEDYPFKEIEKTKNKFVVKTKDATEDMAKIILEKGKRDGKK